MFSCPVLDKMLKENAWLCPIVSSVGDHAFYRPSEDTIFIPLKGQFHTGENFYRTMLHEMAHSTGASTRCAREIRNSFGDPKYGKEELIAEFTAAVSCQSLGIVAGIQDYNAKYLKNWLNAIHEEPRFLYSVLSEVGKASTMILNTVEKLELQAQKNEEQTVIVMTEEEYLASKGYSFSGLGEPALHKGTQKTVRQQNKLLEKQAERNRRYTEKREEFRKEYKEKLAKGEIMKPTIIDQLISTAKGMPELESTQAARRSLEKRGISWAECKETIEAEKTERDSETKDFTLAFKAALAAAISGAFQPLVELKRKGFFPSISDIELLKDIAPQARTAVETIFQIKIDNLHFSKLAESDNKQEVKQLSLNF